MMIVSVIEKEKRNCNSNDISSSAGIILGFIPASVNVRENEGTVNLVVGVLQGTLQTNINIQLATRDGTAVCKSW